MAPVPVKDKNTENDAAENKKEQKFNIGPLAEATILYLENRPFKEVEILIATWRQVLSVIKKGV